MVIHGVAELTSVPASATTLFPCSSYCQSLSETVRFKETSLLVLVTRILFTLDCPAAEVTYVRGGLTLNPVCARAVANGKNRKTGRYLKNLFIELKKDNLRSS